MNNTSSDNQRFKKSLDELLNLYIESMNDYERIAYKIAKNNLESSYDMEKSIGFIEFIKKHNYSIINE
uniref:Uncharacterized protein n=1 Tax=viral metagenome TaxID=1070528 RepID=A0A6C0L0Y7_9ZZZZ|tara:strand:- start:4039 stop:4242 length:204 start_codon:yes stop_codon:yes gene_type:complete